MQKLKKRLYELHHGESRSALVFRWVLFAIDMAVLVYFLFTVARPLTPQIIAIDMALGVFLGIELLIRIWIEPDRKRFLLSFVFLADLIVIASLFAPLLIENFAFLRILRALRFLHSYRTVEELTGFSSWFRKNRHMLRPIANLLVFVFIVTSIIWVLEHEINDQINSWIDALYFTVTTLTTTGFGDIILKDDLGRLFTVVIMVFGVALFLRLVQQIFRPAKIEHSCEHCGLSQHDPDASHCKHCGKIVFIPTEGER